MEGLTPAVTGSCQLLPMGNVALSNQFGTFANSDVGCLAQAARRTQE